MDTTPTGSRAQDLSPCALLPWLYNMGCGMKRIIGLETVPPLGARCFLSSIFCFLFVCFWLNEDICICSMESLSAAWFLTQPMGSWCGCMMRVPVMPEQEKHCPDSDDPAPHVAAAVGLMGGSLFCSPSRKLYKTSPSLSERGNWRLEMWMKHLKWWTKFLKVKLSLTNDERGSSRGSPLPWLQELVIQMVSVFPQVRKLRLRVVKEQDHSRVRQQPLLLLLGTLDSRHHEALWIDSFRKDFQSPCFFLCHPFGFLLHPSPSLLSPSFPLSLLVPFPYFLANFLSLHTLLLSRFSRVRLCATP